MYFTDLILIESKSSEDFLLLNGWVFLINNKHGAGGIGPSCGQSAPYGGQLACAKVIYDYFKELVQWGKNSTNCNEREAI